MQGRLGGPPSLGKHAGDYTLYNTGAHLGCPPSLGIIAGALLGGPPCLGKHAGAHLGCPPCLGHERNQNLSPTEDPHASSCLAAPHRTRRCCTCAPPWMRVTDAHLFCPGFDARQTEMCLSWSEFCLSQIEMCFSQTERCVVHSSILSYLCCRPLYLCAGFEARETEIGLSLTEICLSQTGICLSQTEMRIVRSSILFCLCCEDSSSISVSLLDPNNVSVKSKGKTHLFRCLRLSGVQTAQPFWSLSGPGVIGVRPFWAPCEPRATIAQPFRPSPGSQTGATQVCCALRLAGGKTVQPVWSPSGPRVIEVQPFFSNSGPGVIDVQPLWACLSLESSYCTLQV